MIFMVMSFFHRSSSWWSMVSWDLKFFSFIIPFLMQGVKAVIAESYERIHRSNLIGMGIAPLQYLSGQTADSLGLTGKEKFTIALHDGLHPGDKVHITVRGYISKSAHSDVIQWLIDRLTTRICLKVCALWRYSMVDWSIDYEDMPQSLRTPFLLQSLRTLKIDSPRKQAEQTRSTSAYLWA